MTRLFVILLFFHFFIYSSQSKLNKNWYLSSDAKYELVFDDDDLTWGITARAAGVEQAGYPSRITSTS